MKVKIIPVSELDSSTRLTAASYMVDGHTSELSECEEHSLEISALVSVRAMSPNGKQINGTDRIKVKFKVGQVREIIRAHGAKSIDEVRELVSDLIRGNIVAALTEATRKKT